MARHKEKEEAEKQRKRIEEARRKEEKERQRKVSDVCLYFAYIIPRQETDDYILLIFIYIPVCKVVAKRHMRCSVRAKT